MRSVKTAATDAGIRRRLIIVRRSRRDGRSLRILDGFLRGAGGPLFLSGFACSEQVLWSRSGPVSAEILPVAAGCRGVARTGWPGGDGIGWILHSLAMRDEFIIAGSAGPRRNIRRHAAGPMRPIIGNGSPANPLHDPSIGPRASRIATAMCRLTIICAVGLLNAPQAYAGRPLTIVFDRAHSFDHFHGLDRVTAVQ